MSVKRTIGWRRTLAALFPLLLVAAACGGDDDDDASDTTAVTSDTSDSTGTTNGDPSGDLPGAGVSVGLALPGPQNDKGFNQAHYNGILLAEEELGITSKVQENVADPDARIDALRNLADGNELVIGVGAEFAEAGLTIAPQFPDVEFMIINGQTDEAVPNLHVYGVRQGVPAYIAGVVAASGLIPDLAVDTVGYVGGEEIPPTTQSDDGMKAGVADTDDGIEYVSTIVGNFNDAPKAKEAAAAQLASGADVIFGLVDAGFPGVIQAAEEAGGEAHLFSVIFPRCDDYPNLVGTAFLNSDVLVAQMVEDFLNDAVPAEPLYFGVENLDIQRLELCPSFQTEELTALVDETTAGIVDGSIALPEGV
ncbi:MAG: BMP family ABC transporter substrate-binding protein [Acidimicrobiia bacterium]|nr:BMP family ABC transporter substrate-binding protein [Acidimicrobiia bacterium]